MIQPQDKYVLRLPDGMRDRLKMAAELNSRSMNAEIIERVRYTFGPVDEEMEALALQVRERDEQISELKSQIAAAEGARDELRAENFALQELLKKQHEGPPIASDTALTSELFDKVFSHLVRLEQKIDGKQET